MEEIGHEPHIDCLIHRLLEMDFCASVCVCVCVWALTTGVIHCLLDLLPPTQKQADEKW